MVIYGGIQAAAVPLQCIIELSGRWATAAQDEGYRTVATSYFPCGTCDKLIHYRVWLQICRYFGSDESYFQASSSSPLLILIQQPSELDEQT